MIEYIFDIDGTLTPSRQPIDPRFYLWFHNWTRTNITHFVTGSDYNKVIEQLGRNIFNTVHYCFTCSGNDIYHNNQHIYRNEWRLTPIQYEWLTNKLNNSQYPHRYGNHIEERVGTTNFSIAGRNATREQRAHYYQWDKEHGERKEIANQFMETFPELDAQIGGEISMDIFPLGKDKRQALHWLEPHNKYIFFGDHCEPGGNDHSIATAVRNKNGVAHHVSNWTETWDLLKKYSLEKSY